MAPGRRARPVVVQGTHARRGCRHHVRRPTPVPEPQPRRHRARQRRDQRDAGEVRERSGRRSISRHRRVGPADPGRGMGHLTDVRGVRRGVRRG